MSDPHPTVSALADLAMRLHTKLTDAQPEHREGLQGDLALVRQAIATIQAQGREIERLRKEAARG